MTLPQRLFPDSLQKPLFTSKSSTSDSPQATHTNFPNEMATNGPILNSNFVEFRCVWIRYGNHSMVIGKFIRQIGIIRSRIRTRLTDWCNKRDDQFLIIEFFWMENLSRSGYFRFVRHPRMNCEWTAMANECHRTVHTKSLYKCQEVARVTGATKSHLNHWRHFELRSYRSHREATEVTEATEVAKCLNPGGSWRNRCNCSEGVHRKIKF